MFYLKQTNKQKYFHTGDQVFLFPSFFFIPSKKAHAENPVSLFHIVLLFFLNAGWSKTDRL